MSEPARPRDEFRQAARLSEPLHPERVSFARTFDALRDRNFQWFFASLMGNFSSMNIQMFIRGWLVFELTGSYESLGLISLANGLSGLVLAIAGGIIADRARQKKHVVQVCQGLNALTALSVGLLIAYGRLEFQHLFIAALVQGGVMTLMMPSRQALTPDVVGMRRLTNAIALNTSGMNAARLLMPSLAGWFMAALQEEPGTIDGAQYIYFAMCGLYLWSIVGLLPVRIADRVRPPGKRSSPVQELVEGFRYVAHTPVIRLLLACNFLMVLFSMTYFMLLPGFAKQVLDTGPAGLGVLVSSSGVGSLIGSLVIASLPNRRRGLVLLLSAMLVGVGLVAFSASNSYWLSVLLLGVVGLGQAGRMSLSNILIQSHVEDAYRGRVMALYMMEFSLMSVSVFLVGILASEIGPQLAVGLSAVGLLLLVSFLLLFSPRYRGLD